MNIKLPNGNTVILFGTATAVTLHVEHNFTFNRSGVFIYERDGNYKISLKWDF